MHKVADIIDWIGIVIKMKKLKIVLGRVHVYFLSCKRRISAFEIIVKHLKYLSLSLGWFLKNGVSFSQLSKDADEIGHQFEILFFRIKDQADRDIERHHLVFVTGGAEVALIVSQKLFSLCYNYKLHRMSVIYNIILFHSHEW